MGMPLKCGLLDPERRSPSCIVFNLRGPSPLLRLGKKTDHFDYLSGTQEGVRIHKFHCFEGVCFGSSYCCRIKAGDSEFFSCNNVTCVWASLPGLWCWRLLSGYWFLRPHQPLINHPGMIQIDWSGKQFSFIFHKIGLKIPSKTRHSTTHWYKWKSPSVFQEESLTGVRKRRNQEINWQGAWASIPEESLVSSIPVNAIALMLSVVSRTSLSANTGSVREGVLAERITHIRHMSILTVENKHAFNH